MRTGRLVCSVQLCTCWPTSQSGDVGAQDDADYRGEWSIASSRVRSHPSLSCTGQLPINQTPGVRQFALMRVRSFAPDRLKSETILARAHGSRFLCLSPQLTVYRASVPVCLWPEKMTSTCAHFYRWPVYSANLSHLGDQVSGALPPNHFARCHFGQSQRKTFIFAPD